MFWAKLHSTLLSLRDAGRVDTTETYYISISARKLPLRYGIYTPEHDAATSTEWRDICLHLRAILNLLRCTDAVAIGSCVGDYLLNFNLESIDPETIEQLKAQKVQTGNAFIAPVDFSKLTETQFERLITHALRQDTSYTFEEPWIVMSIVGPHSEILFTCWDDEIILSIEQYCKAHKLVHIVGFQEQRPVNTNLPYC